mgnify:CR=1 FL=1
MQKEKIKVYTYTRVSTAMQVDGYSLDAQKAKMKAYATTMIMRSSVNMRMRESPANPLKDGRNSVR